MLKSKELQPHILEIVINSGSFECPICGTRDQLYQLPTRCRECGSKFEWKVTVHYKEPEENEKIIEQI